MDLFLQWFSQLKWGRLIEVSLSAAGCMVCIVLHELCHGLTALWMGDDTTRRAGRLTINPLKHIDPVGLVLLFTVRFGWAKPVPVNMLRFHRPRLGMALTAMAGPICNLLLALVLTPLYAAVFVGDQLYGGVFTHYFGLFLISTISVSIGLAVFNLLPVPPLEGSRLPYVFLVRKYYFGVMKYEKYIALAIMLLLFVEVLSPVINLVTDGIMGLLVKVFGL